MKKILSFLIIIFSVTVFAQEHFSAITTSQRVGLTNASINPSELTNLNSRFEVHILSFSTTISNNKISFGDIIGEKDLEKLIFSGNEAVNFSVDAEIMGPGFGMKFMDWGFAFTTKSTLKATIIDIDPTLGEAVSNSSSNVLIINSAVNNRYNQRANATAWGEIGLSAARKIFEDDKHQINGGITFKLLFPGSYANIGLNQINGTIRNTGANLYLNNVSNANLNFTYSGSLADNFNNSSTFSKSVFGNLRGLGTDIGFNYKLKGVIQEYKVKVGASIRNIGSMSFKGEDNVSKNYSLNINDSSPVNAGLNLDQFKDVESIKDVEKILLNSNGRNGVQFTATTDTKDLKVKLPTVFNFYADVNVIPKFSITAFLQQRLNDNNDNDQITALNSLSLTPRFTISLFEVFSPLSFNENAGTLSGLGFRLGGFFMGSNSAFSAIAGGKQGDFYMGYRYGFL
ncbi:MAG TPA: hypothetical protein VF677_06225 [Flavobacterium sp.]|jgi:hypothetical protein